MIIAFLLSTWQIILIIAASLTLISFALVYIDLLMHESNQQNHHIAKKALESAIDLSIKTCFKIPPSFSLDNSTYRIILFTMLLCGFLIFNHYEAIFASNLIAESAVEPYESWEDIANSKMNILVWKGTLIEDYFLNAPSGSILHEIHKNKIKGHPSLADIGLHKSLEVITKSDFFLFEDLTVYKTFDEFPCKVASLKSISLRYENNHQFEAQNIISNNFL